MDSPYRTQGVPKIPNPGARQHHDDELAANVKAHSQYAASVASLVLVLLTTPSKLPYSPSSSAWKRPPIANLEP